MHVDLYVYFIPLYFLYMFRVLFAPILRMGANSGQVRTESELDRAKSVRVSQPVPAAMD
jgi:hypothetical protein